jgi:tRNA(Ile)-lysidine synthase
MPPQLWTPLHAQVHRTLKQRGLIPAGQNVLIAVSGGQDSLCLSKILLDLQPKWDWQLAIAHCDHGWREDSAANAEHVAALAGQWQLEFWLRTATVPPTTEAQARDWRYQQLTELAQSHQCAVVVTGHTASDRAETLLYNLIRGSGADGLQALTWQRSLATGIQLVRPLLEITRSRTGQFCNGQSLAIWQDSTNQDWQYRRNRIRQELLPYLQTHFNPQVESAIAQTAELLQADVEYLEHQATELLQSAQADEPTTADSSRQFNRQTLRTVPLALQRRAVRQFLQQTIPTQPNFEHIEKVISLIAAPNGSCSDPFPGGAIAKVVGDQICLIKLD